MSRMLTPLTTPVAVLGAAVFGLFFASYLRADDVTVGGTSNSEPASSDAASPSPEPTKKKLNFPKTGLLASVLASPESAAVDMPWGASNEIGNIESPLLGSIRKSEGNWVVSLSNTSKDITLDVNVELAQYNKQGQKVKSDPFSYSLAPGAKVQRPVTAVTQGIAKVDLNLTGWKQK